MQKNSFDSLFLSPFHRKTFSVGIGGTGVQQHIQIILPHGCLANTVHFHIQPPLARIVEVQHIVRFFRVVVLIADGEQRLIGQHRFFRQQRAAHKNMVSLGVAHEAWAPFAEGKGGIFKNPTLLALAEKHGKTVGQVILRALIQSDVIVIPKTVRPERMAENIDVFDFVLDAEDMAAFATVEDPDFPPIFDHFDVSTVKWMLGELVHKQQLGGAPLY